MRRALPIAALVMIVARAAHADPVDSSKQTAEAPRRGTSVVRDTKAYCDWQESIADATSDPMIAPSIYVSGGYVSGADATEGASALPPTQRLIAAANYSFGGLNQGLSVRAQAKAECARYATESELRAFIERNRDGGGERALAARAKVLDDALPHAVEILESERQMLALSRLTVDELGATELRIDALRQLASDTKRDIEALASLPAAPVRPVTAVLAERDHAEEEAERADGRVRASHGWDLSIRGGYDQIFGVRDSTPLFAMATATLNLGWLFQGGANSDARDARRLLVRSEVEGLDDRVEQVTQRLRAIRRAEASRETQTAALLKDLEGRFKTVSAIPGEKARAYADIVWFDIVRARADHSYFLTHIEELDVLLSNRAESP